MFKHFIVTQQTPTLFRASVQDNPVLNGEGNNAAEAIGHLLMRWAHVLHVSVDLPYEERGSFAGAVAQTEASLNRARAIIGAAGGVSKLQRRDIIDLASLPCLVTGDYLRLGICEQMKEIREEARRICLESGFNHQELTPDRADQWIPAALLR